MEKGINTENGEKGEEGPKRTKKDQKETKRRPKGEKRTKNEVGRDPLGFSGISAQPIRGHQALRGY